MIVTKGKIIDKIVFVEVSFKCPFCKEVKTKKVSQELSEFPVACGSCGTLEKFIVKVNNLKI